MTRHPGALARATPEGGQPHEPAEHRRKKEKCQDLVERERFPQRLSRGGSRRSGRPGISRGRQGAGADYDALAEHLADQGHFSRVRPRLRQEGERHDRRRPQDRGAAGRRRGAGLRPAGGGLQGHARRRPRGVRLPLRQAECAGAVGVEPGVRHGCQHDALLAQVRRRQGAAGEDLLVHQRQRGLLCLRADDHPAARLVQEADHQDGGLQGHEVPYGRHFHRSVQRLGRGRERAARRRDRAGPGPRPAGRGGVQQRHLRPPARLPRCVEGLHAAELPPERRSPSRSCSTRPSTTRCRTR